MNPPFLDRLLGGLAISSCIALATHSLLTLWNFPIESYFSDDWRILFQRADLPFPQSIMTVQNGHPFMSSTAGLLLIDRFFDGNMNVLFRVGLIVHSSLCGLIACAVWRDVRLGTFAPVVAALVGTLPLWLANGHRMSWGTAGLSAPLSLLLSIFSFAALVVSVRHTDRNRGLFFAALTLAVFATATSGGGVATLPTVLLGTILLRAPRWQQGLVALFVASAAAILMTASAGRLPSSPNPEAFYQWTTTRLGAFPTLYAPSLLRQYAGGIGLFVLLIAGGMFIHATRTAGRRDARLDLHWIALLTLVSGIGTAMLTAIAREGRFETSPALAFTPRYFIYDLPIWLPLGFVWFRFSVQHLPRFVTLTCLLLSVAVWPQQLRFESRLIAASDQRAMIAGAFVDNTPSPRDWSTPIEFRRHYVARRGSTFHHNRSLGPNLPEQQFDLPESGQHTPRTCRIEWQEASRVVKVDGGARLRASGVFSGNHSITRPARIRSLRPDGGVTGFAVVARSTASWWPDVQVNHPMTAFLPLERSDRELIVSLLPDRFESCEVRGSEILDFAALAPNKVESS